MLRRSRGAPPLQSSTPRAQETPSERERVHAGTARRFQEEVPDPEEERRREERRQQRREEKRRKRDEKARQREEAAEHGGAEEEAADNDSSEEREKKRRISSKDGAISTKIMDDSMRRFWGQSVKGMVSTDYKGFSDAALERRFQLQNAAGSGEKLMSEEEVLSMLKKTEKQSEGGQKKRR